MSKPKKRLLLRLSPVVLCLVALAAILMTIANREAARHPNRAMADWFSTTDKVFIVGIILSFAIQGYFVWQTSLKRPFAD